MNKKKIIIIALSLVLFLVAGAFVSLFGKQDFEKVKDKINEATKQETVVNDNLIYNANFKINSRNISKFNQDNITTYEDKFLDGWNKTNFNGSTFEVVQVENGMFVSVVGEENKALSMQQPIEDDSAVIGQSITMSFSVNGVVYSKSFTETIDGEYYALGIDNGLYLQMFRHSDGSSVFYVEFRTGFEGILNWVKLETGTVFTGYSDGPSSYNG